MSHLYIMPLIFLILIFGGFYFLIPYLFEFIRDLSKEGQILVLILLSIGGLGISLIYLFKV